tara:strand:+ start:229 stop:1623 length:1395 start_codon:yes stop_codon:yes gene_type:complete
MAIKFFNTLSREKEKFSPIKSGEIGLYTCGPTVYDFAHIGNFRTFIFEDLLKRYLIHKGYRVNHIMNITDVDDKTIKKSIVENISLKELTNKYSNTFFSDSAWLKILPADNYPRATESIDKMIDLISSLLKKGFAYAENDGSVYFRINSYPQYGQLVNLDFNNQAISTRIANDEYNKENPQDFALWKGWQDSDGEIAWDSPWGKGRPGWHIECSAMSNIHLGDYFDIHCGGVDNIFPHHENEIAQSKCATGKKFVNYWLHSEHLIIEGKKMSKSEGALFNISDLKKIDFSAECLRYLLLSGHYRKKILFSIRKKHEGDKIISRINEFKLRLESIKSFSENLLEYPKEYNEFMGSLDNDLDTPNALSIFLKWMREQNLRFDKGERGDQLISSCLNFVNAVDDIFGFLPVLSDKAPNSIRDMAERREVARKNKDWDLADKMRDDIISKGWLIEDLSDGYKLKEVKK